MRGRQILRFWDDGRNGRKQIVTKDRSDIDMESGEATNQAQEQGDN